MDAALGAQTYTVTATAGAGGTVSPASQIVASGSTAPFTVTPDAGYTADVAVGGTCAAGSWSGTTYTTGVVTAACSVSFTFSVGPGLGDAVDNPTLSWSSSGNAQWLVENTIYNSGGSAAQSGDISNSQTSAIQTTVTGPGSLSFYWKVSSEIDYDWLEFAIDGTVQTRMSGTSSWLKKSYSISAGSHTLSWTYTKDTTSSSGSDAGWLDTVVFTPQSGVTLTATAGTGGSVTPASQRVASGSTASFTAVANTGYTPNTTVGGTCAAGSWSGTTYTTGAVTASCSVSFTFTPQVGSLTVTISPAGAITAGAMWRVDGGAWQASGATVSNVAVGSPTVSFNTVAGYTTPANQNVAVTTIGTATATGTYTAITESTGSLTVTILPPDAVAAGAQWRVDGGPWQADGATVTELANGSHTVWFSPTTGYRSPANKNVTVTMGQTATSSGTYTLATGSGAVKVNILPAGAVTAGAQWSVDGGATWNASGDTLNGLTAGSYTVSFDSLSDYTSPEDKVVNVTNGGTAISTGTYKQHGSLKVTILPAGAANGGAQWSVDGGTTWNASGDIVPGLTAGKQTVMFNTAATDYSPPANRIVTITPGRTATATGTYTRGYNVLAKVSTGGTATPAKRVVLTGGSTATVTVTARTGYTTSATVGGTCVAGSWNGTDYTTGPVTEACTALFTFTKAPTVTTGSALRITQTDAILNGRVNPENDSTTVTFEYVDDATFLVSAYTTPSSVTAAVLTGGTAQNVAAPVTGLMCGTKYHFRVVGMNAVNTTNGLDRTFTTSVCPVPDRAADSATDTATSPTSDFDGDGKSDILFRDAVTGQTQAWIMDGVTVTSNLVTSLNAGAYSSTIGWQAQGIGDFDGDKKYDLLWRDSASGQVAVWTMNGADVVTTSLASMSPGAYTATTGWQIQGIGDFDGDVKSDILWRDAGTGQTAIWFMSGSTVMSSSNTNVSAGAYTATAGWQVHGVGDFNGDGKSDILWRQIGTGRTAIWFMDGAFKSGGGYTNVHAGAYTATTGWQIHGVGDFNADGKSDILWRNADSGVTVVWLMNGAVRASGAYTSVQPGPYTTTTGWHVQGVGDFNGDWKSDVLLRYAGTGQTFIWLMNGATVTGDWTSIHAGVFDSATGLQILSEETIR
ncbi:MAG: VCBS repeat-containing protein [Nitrospinae bacterium]|nr:VCBS repeat-containing protein [Nitrospinota bacterium]